MFITVIQRQRSWTAYSKFEISNGDKSLILVSSRYSFSIPVDVTEAHSRVDNSNGDKSLIPVCYCADILVQVVPTAASRVSSSGVALSVLMRYRWFLRPAVSVIIDTTPATDLLSGVRPTSFSLSAPFLI